MKLEKQFLEVVQLIKQAQSNAYKAINVELINCNWQVGEYISNRIAQAAWGNKTVDELALFIEKRHPDLKGYSRSALYRIRQFYETYRNSKFVAPVARQIQNNNNHLIKTAKPVVGQMELSDIRTTILSAINWTNHLIILSKAKTEEEREFYIRLSIRENYGKRELERQICSSIFERVKMGNLKLSSKLRDINPGISNTFKSDYVLEFLNLPMPHSENDLQKALIVQMKTFILELGKDFLFMGEEYRIQVGNSDFKTDLLFFHRTLQCMVLFELKTDKFKPEYLGQLNFYLEALDRDVKKEHEKPSIGILLCTGQDNEVVRYSLNRSLSPALVAAYQMQLPDKKLLQQRLHEIIENNDSRKSII
ncbi:MAG TPA: PDDEXK nuclease domain-containing protein [Puia sp.]|nr:PDDEXK nuclease domain-containing protein [Puia sp.]